MATLHWQMRDVLPQLGERGRLTVLIDLLLRCDQLRYRCYPSIKKISKDTGLSTSVVDAALDWLVASKALIKVGYVHRIGKEKKLPNRQSVYQLTGVLVVDDKEYPYLFLNPETHAIVSELVRHANGHISENEISENEILDNEISYSETEGITSIKGTAKGKGKKESTKPDGKVHFSKPDMDAMGEAIRAAFQWEQPNKNEWGQISKAAYDLLASPVAVEDVLPLYRYCKKRFTNVKPTTLAGNVSDWRRTVPQSRPATPAPDEDTSDYIQVDDSLWEGMLK